MNGKAALNAFFAFWTDNFQKFSPQRNYNIKKSPTKIFLDKFNKNFSAEDFIYSLIFNSDFANKTAFPEIFTLSPTISHFKIPPRSDA